MQREGVSPRNPFLDDNSLTILSLPNLRREYSIPFYRLSPYTVTPRKRGIRVIAPPLFRSHSPPISPLDTLITCSQSQPHTYPSILDVALYKCDNHSQRIYDVQFESCCGHPSTPITSLFLVGHVCFEFYFLVTRREAAGQIRHPALI